MMRALGRGLARARTRGLRLLLVTLAFGASVALAEDAVKRRTFGVVFREQVPHIYYSARDLVTAEAVRKLDSGLPQRIVVQHFAYATRGGAALAAAGHSCRVTFDLWQAAYRVEREILGGASEIVMLRTRAEVLERCLVMLDVPIGTASDYQETRTFYVASLIELNPLSSSTVARIRRWLSQPRGDYDREHSAFFGSFVSLFVNDRIGTADRVLRLRSQDVESR